MPMAQSQGRECADCLGNRRLERRLSLRRAEKHAFHGRGKLLLIGVMQQQKLQWGPLCPRQHCPTAWKNVSHYGNFSFTTHQHAQTELKSVKGNTSHTSQPLHSHARDMQRVPRSQTRIRSRPYRPGQPPDLNPCNHLAFHSTQNSVTPSHVRKSKTRLIFYMYLEFWTQRTGSHAQFLTVTV